MKVKLPRESPLLKRSTPFYWNRAIAKMAKGTSQAHEDGTSILCSTSNPSPLESWNLSKPKMPQWCFKGFIQNDVLTKLVSVKRLPFKF